MLPPLIVISISNVISSNVPPPVTLLALSQTGLYIATSWSFFIISHMLSFCLSDISASLFTFFCICFSFIMLFHLLHSSELVSSLIPSTATFCLCVDQSLPFFSVNLISSSFSVAFFFCWLSTRADTTYRILSSHYYFYLNLIIFIGFAHFLHCQNLSNYSRSAFCSRALSPLVNGYPFD